MRIEKKREEILNLVQFLCHWIISVCVIEFIYLCQQFIGLWLGKNYLLEQIVVVFIGISCYIQIMNLPYISVQNALGLHKYDKNIMIYQAILNFILSIIFVKKDRNIRSSLGYNYIIIIANYIKIICDL